MLKVEEWTPETVTDSELEDRLANNTLGAKIDHVQVHQEDGRKVIGIVLDNGVSIWLEECWLGFEEV